MTTEDGDGEGHTVGDWEYRPLRIPAGISRRAAAIQLSINAELGGWELCRTLLFADGSRHMWLRRKRPRHLMPGIIV
ncbi:DUF5703 family protein [Sciscionella marina]|uniref:DUF5703 family protein n=1 Tax=Sciscionella marina TaxID=508770 RepID=UPI000377354E|nr:DUF5703 family protein [Sciscionella marina]